MISLKADMVYAGISACLKENFSSRQELKINAISWKVLEAEMKEDPHTLLHCLNKMTNGFGLNIHGSIDNVKVFNLPRFEKRVDTCEFVENCLDGEEILMQEELEKN